MLRLILVELVKNRSECLGSTFAAGGVSLLYVALSDRRAVSSGDGTQPPTAEGDE